MRFSGTMPPLDCYRKRQAQGLPRETSPVPGRLWYNSARMRRRVTHRARRATDGIEHSDSEEMEFWEEVQGSDHG